MPEIFEPLAFEQEMRIGRDKYSYRNKQDILKSFSFGGKEVDSKQTLSGHAACIIGVDRRIRSTAVSKINTILYLRLKPKLNELFKA